MHIRSDGTWNDDQCETQRPYVCGFSAAVAPTRSFFKINSEKTFWDAEEYCVQLGGHLASVHSSMDTVAILAINAGAAWIGFHDSGTNEALCDGSGIDGTGFAWTDGLRSDYTKWAAGEPNDWQDGRAQCDGGAAVGEDCVHLYGDATWNDLDCESRRSFVCGFIGLVPPVATRTTLPTVQTDTFDVINSTCTQISTENHYDYNENFVLTELSDSRSIIFQVQANNDAHIGFFTKLPEEQIWTGVGHEHYEIVLSGWGNTMSVIREKSQGINHGAVDTTGILSLSEPRTFWASAKDGHIRIGTGEVVGRYTITQWTDDDGGLDVKFVAVSTGWGSPGEWTVCVGAQDDQPLPEALCDFGRADVYSGVESGGAYTDVCLSTDGQEQWSGTLEDAKRACLKNPECHGVFDADGDADASVSSSIWWRFCLEKPSAEYGDSAKGQWIAKECHASVAPSAIYFLAGDAVDNSGTRHGLVTGATVQHDRNGVLNEAMYFSGSAHIALPTPFRSSDQAFTIVLWLVSDVVGDNAWHGFAGHQASGTRSPSLWVNRDPAGATSGGMHWDARTTQYGDGQRYHGVVDGWFVSSMYVHTVFCKSVSSNEFRFYQDGTLRQRTLAPDAVDLHTQYWIGRVDNYFTGALPLHMIA